MTTYGQGFMSVGGLGKAQRPQPMRIGVREYLEEPAPLSSRMRHALEGIPDQYATLFKQYLVKVNTNLLERMMWVSLSNGHRVMQLEKDMHIFVTSKFLRSKDDNRIREAIEAMERTLETWEIRG